MLWGGVGVMSNIMDCAKRWTDDRQGITSKDYPTCLSDIFINGRPQMFNFKLD